MSHLYGGSPLQQPDYGSAMYALGGKSQSELQLLMEDEDKFQELIKALPQVKQLYNEKEMLLASNKSLAEYNLSMEPKMNSARVSLQSAHRETVKAVERVKRLKAEVAEKSGNADPDAMLAILQAAHSKSDEESERLAESFMSGDGGDNVDDFLASFLEQRKVTHLRRIKIDKMKELLANQRRGGGGTTSNGAAPYPPCSQSNNPISPSRRAPGPPGMPGYPAPPPSASYVPPPTGSWGGPAAQVAYPPPPASSTANLPYPIQPRGMPTYPY